MAPGPLTPPPDGDRNNGTAIISMSWIECLIVLIAIALRLNARKLIKNIGLDDWIMFFTAVRDAVLREIEDLLPYEIKAHQDDSRCGSFLLRTRLSQL